MKKKYNNSSWTNIDSSFYQKKEWRSLRKKYIDENPLDELKLQFGIIEAGVIVDHIIPRRLAEELEFEWNNLQTLSFLSHQQKTAQGQKIDNLEGYIHHMKKGKLQNICTEEKKEKLFKLLIEKGLYEG